jgi:hypothetical protein
MFWTSVDNRREYEEAQRPAAGPQRMDRRILAGSDDDSDDAAVDDDDDDDEGIAVFTASRRASLNNASPLLPRRASGPAENTSFAGGASSTVGPMALAGASTATGGSARRQRESATRARRHDKPEAAVRAARKLDMLSAQLENSESMHACDVLDALTNDDGDAGFNEELFMACRGFVHSAERYDAVYGTSSTTDVDKQTHLDRGVAEELSHYNELKWHRKVLIFLEHPDSSRLAYLFYILITLVVVTSCLSTILETMPQYNPVIVPSYEVLWRALDWTTTILLTAETGCRLVVTVLDDTVHSSKAQNFVKFLTRPSNIADILALLPTYMALVLPTAGRVLAGSLRTARLMRLLKFLRRFQPIRRLGLALQRSFFGLVAPFCFLGMSLLLLASFVFFSERGTYDAERGLFMVDNQTCINAPRYFLNASSTCPRIESRFISMWQGMWWAIVTIATVGYGDFVPITSPGQIVGSATMIMGVIFVAMPIAVIGTNYTIVLDETKKVQEGQVQEALADAEQDKKRAALTMPGEAMLRALQQLLPSATVDLRDPGDDVLYIVDMLLERTVKELCNVDCLGANRPPLFAATSGRAEAQLPLWTGSVLSQSPSPDGSSSPNALGRSARRSPSSGPRGQSVLYDGKTDVIESFTLSRPSTVTLGSSTGAASLAEPDVAVYSQDVHHALEAAAAAAAVTTGARSPPQKGMPLPSIERIGVSHQHAVVVLARVWGETRVILRNHANREVRVNGELIDVWGAQQLEAAAREHLLRLTKEDAETMMHRRSAATLGIAHRAKMQERLLRAVELESRTAVFRFQHQRLRHWADMEPVPVVLAPGDRLQFGAAVTMAGSTAQRRVADAPKLTSSQVSLVYRYEDNSFP